MNAKKKIGIYIRVSSRERADFGHGLDAQRNGIKRYIESIYGMDFKDYEVYMDDGVSAKNLNRPALNKLTEEIKAGDVKEMIVYKLDRLSRVVTDVYEYMRMLEELGCNLIAIIDSVNIHSANGRLFIGVLAIISQWERETVIERTNDGLVACVEKGKSPLPRNPFGYAKNEEGNIIIDKETSQYVYSIFEYAKEGFSCQKIAELMNEDMGCTIKFTDEKILRIIDNSVYFGDFFYKGKLYIGIFPPYIDQETFNFINKIRFTRNVYENNHHYLFGTKVRCICGEIADRSCTIKHGKTYYYYVCRKCKKRINQDTLIKETYFMIEDQNNTEALDKAHLKLSNKLVKISKKKEEVFDQYLANNLKIDEYTNMIAKLSFEEKNIMQLDENLNAVHHKDWNMLTVEEKYEIIQATFKYIVYDFNAKSVVKMISK
ncbi:MAG: recombinase family protein [Erysipelotrichaceae bacterium]